jgi:hypothetical protein
MKVLGFCKLRFSIYFLSCLHVLLNIGFYLLLMLNCAMAMCVSASEQKDPPAETVYVEEGASFRVEMPTNLPEKAYPALRLYLKMLSLSHHLPWPYHMEKFDVQKGKIVLQGMMLSSGIFQIPLGVLWWNGAPYILPSFACTSAAVRAAHPTAAQLLLPFPKEALLANDQNVQLGNEVLANNHNDGFLMLRWREAWRHLFILVCLHLICFPAVLQLWRWRKLKERPEAILAPITPAALLLEAKQLQSQGEMPWEKLVYVLNLAASSETPSLTSYELAQRFTKSGEKELAEASAMIERYGYGLSADQYFGQTLALVERGIKTSREA